MPRLISSNQYLYIFLTLTAFTALSGIFGNPLGFATTASISAVNILGLFLSEIEFKERPDSAIVSQISISLVSYGLMHLHETLDWF